MCVYELVYFIFSKYLTFNQNERFDEQIAQPAAAGRVINWNETMSTNMIGH